MAAAPKVKREGVRVQCIHNGHIVSEDSSKKINGAATPTAIVVIPGRGGRGARGVGPKPKTFFSHLRYRPGLLTVA
jgi:hypothetical protein